jgi:GNAT superfamily N-acetyltransferase
MELEERRRLADENVVAAFSLVHERLLDPRGGIRQFGAVHAIASGVDTAFFNPVFALDRAAKQHDARAAVEWVESKGLPVSVHVRDGIGAELPEALTVLGMVARPWSMPVMVLEPIPDVPPGPSPAATVIRVGRAELLEDFHAANQSGETFRRLFGRAIAADPRVRLAVGDLDGEPVSAAAAIGSGSTIGIYAVGTREAARRRGIGRAVTWAAMEAGRAAWGGTIAILQSSEMGVPVYQSMGFEEAGRYVLYERPTD